MLKDIREIINTDRLMDGVKIPNGANEPIYGLGSDLAEQVRHSMVYVLTDMGSWEDSKSDLTIFMDLLDKLDEHYDDYVKVWFNDMGCFQISDMFDE